MILRLMDSVSRCVSCGDVIGVYEPVVAIDRECARRTSFAREPDLGEQGGMLIHGCCVPDPTVAGDRA